jgi:hypothetical protein
MLASSPLVPPAVSAFDCLRLRVAEHTEEAAGVVASDLSDLCLPSPELTGRDACLHSELSLIAIGRKI